VNAAREPQTRPNAGGLSGRASSPGVDPLRPHGRRARFEITLALDRTPATSRPRPPFVNSAARRQRGIHLRYERDRREIWRIATQRAPAAAPPAPWAAGSTRATTPTTARRAAREAGIAAGDPPQMSFLQPRRTVHGRRARKAPDSRAESIPPSTRTITPRSAHCCDSRAEASQAEGRPSELLRWLGLESDARAAPASSSDVQNKHSHSEQHHDQAEA